MADSAEQNTEYIRTWIVNDQEYYDEALRLAEAGDMEGLENFIINSLREASEGTDAYYTNQNMTDADFDTVDWDEIAVCLMG